MVVNYWPFPEGFVDNDVDIWPKAATGMYPVGVAGSSRALLAPPAPFSTAHSFLFRFIPPLPAGASIALRHPLRHRHLALIFHFRGFAFLLHCTTSTQCRDKLYIAPFHDCGKGHVGKSGGWKRKKFVVEGAYLGAMALSLLQFLLHAHHCHPHRHLAGAEVTDPQLMETFSF